MTFNQAAGGSLHHARLQIIRSLIGEYQGEFPFHHYLKSAFRKNKHFGSRDRRIYSTWCYAFWRLGKALATHDFNIRLAVAWFLIHEADDDFFRFLCKEMNLETGELPTENSLTSRVTFISSIFPDFEPEAIFPFRSAQSGYNSRSAVALSHLIQPAVWIRVLKGWEETVVNEFQQQQIHFEHDHEIAGAYSLIPGTKLDNLFSRKQHHFEIQDRSSQLAGFQIPAKPGEHWWDCCCGAGGKSLQLLDRVPDITITASDARVSILENFMDRAQRFHSQLNLRSLDLETKTGNFDFGNNFDGILADVPCTGSGTWGRTPEKLSFFDETEIAFYVRRQQKIISNAVPFLRKGGSFVYITCSLFRDENENMVSWILENSEMKLISQQTIDGSRYKADTMFYAVFVNS